MATKDRKVFKLLKIEKKLLKFCLIMLLLFPVIDVFSKATLSETNIEVERLKQEVQSQSRKNESLTMKVNELKSFENIQNVIQKEGLAYNSNNIKVIAKD
jgi:cell division protein FtsL